MFHRTVFTPDVVKRIVKMKHNGASAQVIARKLNIPLASLERRCSQLGIKRGGRLGTKVGRHTEAAFNAEAHQRGIKPHTLLRRLVTAIVKDKMYTAVLD